MVSFAERMQLLCLQSIPFLLAVVLHEYAHGLMAYQWGDSTAKQQGRLTLNPLAHLDPIGTVLFPMINLLTGFSFLLGWAKPVPINPYHFRKYRLGLFWVSLAGPVMNFLLACVSALVFYAITVWIPPSFYFFEPLLAMAYISISLNYTFCFFNLIPIPPLDGSKILASVLPYSWARKYEAFSSYGFWFLMLLLISGAFSILSIPIHTFSKGTLRIVGRIFGI